jgi:hypothetical protein
VDEAVYARAYHGQRYSWYQAALRQRAGRAAVAGMTKEVSFKPVPSEDAIQDRIDEAYRAKYRGSPYLDSMISARARSATVKIIPRENAI